MHGLKNLLQAEEKRLVRIISMISNREHTYPKGYLKIKKYNGSIRYEHIVTSANELSRKYINSENIDLAEKLAQKSYDHKVLRCANSQLKLIANLNKKYDDGNIDRIYYNLTDERKNLVTPIIPTWEQTLNNWITETYAKKAIGENDSNIIAKKGHRVRSKSEKIIADTFYDNNIDYKYEKPLYLKGYGIVYPDFTFLSSKTRQEIYWEHMGMMDDSEYLASALRKLENYQKHGIFQGEKLIVTFESSNYILSQQVINDLIKRYLV